MKQLASADFINTMKEAPEWQLIEGMGTGQLCMAVRNVPDARPIYFLGPHPWNTEGEEYKAFLAAVEDVIAMRSTHDDQSDTDSHEKK